MRSDADPQALARFFQAQLRGMATVHKATGDLDAMRDAARAELRAPDRWLIRPTLAS